MMETSTDPALALTALIFLAALLYSSVGHAGASGYLAAMALMGMAPESMKPTALTLNILVASITTWKFYRAGHLSWPLLWPFAITSIPAAFLGGTLSVPGHWFKPAVGLVLLYATVVILRPKNLPVAEPPARRPDRRVAAILGAVIGLLSGLIGVGGGIFLTPLLLIFGWAGTRAASGVSAAFILVNSVAGLAGHLSGLGALPTALPYFALAAAAGGLIGAELGSRRLRTPVLRRILGAVLGVAGLKMLAG